MQVYTKSLSVQDLSHCARETGRWGQQSDASLCCSMCAGGDDDLLLLATEVGVVQTSVSGDSAQVVAPMASEGSNGEDTVN